MLDLDMMNMGTRTRRALRNLKVKMQVADPAVSLRPSSDSIQRLLGRRGFENLKRCMVGIPAAGRIPGSGSSSIDSDGNIDFEKWGSKEDDITKMVAKLGRWWYSRCYESLVLPEGDMSAAQSMWADESLLRECEKRGTSFRMLIAYAQKPNHVVRRTVSV